MMTGVFSQPQLLEFPDFLYAAVESLKNKYIFNKIQKFVYQNFLQYFVFKAL